MIHALIIYTLGVATGVGTTAWLWLRWLAYGQPEEHEGEHE